jgi:hypothetical protein
MSHTLFGHPVSCADTRKVIGGVELYSTKVGILRTLTKLSNSKCAKCRKLAKARTAAVLKRRAWMARILVEDLIPKAVN